MSESVIIAETSKGSIAPVTAELVSAAIALGTSPTVVVPCTDASIAECPASRNFAMFSATIMPSSTIIPMTIIKANNEITLMVIPNIGIIKNTPITATGMPKDTQNAICRFKKKESTMITRISPIRPFVIITDRRLLKKKDESLAFTNVRAG